MKAFQQLQARMLRLLVLGTWLGVAVVSAVSFLMGVAPAALSISAALLALAVTGSWITHGNSSVSRSLVAVAIVAMISMVLAALQHHPWQVDIHLAYFAALALVGTFCDWRATLAATTAVAVHHLALNFLLTAAIYPGEADFARVVLHAVVLVTEAAGLGWLGWQLHATFALTEVQAEAADQAKAQAEQALGALQEVQTSEQHGRAEHDRLAREAAASQHLIVQEVTTALGHLADGNLTHTILRDFPAGYRELRDNFNATVQKLRTLMGEIDQRAESLKAATLTITHATDQMAERTERQAAGLEETSAAVVHITDTVSATAQNAQNAYERAVESSHGAEAGGAVVRDAIEAMNRIEASSGKIGQIVGVIDEIAFQTNLLALNAGVEAARAGESGKGFAVVASEVRTLAQRSAEAAKEIKVLIQSSTQEVTSGARLVEKTGEALSLIIGQVGEINRAIGEIASSAKEQSQGLAEVKRAVREMDEITQRNAAMVEESTAASHAVANEAEELSRLMTRFATGEAATRSNRQPRLALAG